MTEQTRLLAEVIANDIEIEEFKLLRQEIMYYNEAAFRTEIYAVSACGFVWGWIVFQIDVFNSLDKLTAVSLLPFMLLLAGYTRYNALKFRVKRLAHYIYCIERKHFAEREKTSGWEHFVARTRPNDRSGALKYDKDDKVAWAIVCEDFKTRHGKYRFGHFERWANLTWLAALLVNLVAVWVVWSLFKPASGLS